MWVGGGKARVHPAGGAKLGGAERGGAERGGAERDEDGCLALLADSLRHQTREFFNNSTLHGVRYIAEKDRPFCEKFMWFSFTATGAVATCVIIVSLWEKFQTNPTITGLDTDFHNWDVPFPAVTACDGDPLDPRLVDDYINSTWGGAAPAQAGEFLLWLATLSWASLPQRAAAFAADAALAAPFARGEDLRDAVFSTARRCDGTFYDCQWKGDAEECCELLQPAFTEHGFCHAFNSRHAERTWPWQSGEPPEQFVEAFIHETDARWSFLFNLDHNHSVVDVYIHAAEEQCGPELSPQLSWDRRVERLSFSVKHTYTTDDARQLSVKQRRCVFADEQPLETSPVYTYSGCMRQCRVRLSRDLCGCVPHFYPAIPGYRYCGLGELACAARAAAALLAASCGCELGCLHSVYEVEKLTEIEGGAGRGATLSSSLEVEFVSWPMVRYKREVLFGWVDLLVSFGGIAGLFLGFSLLSGVECVYYFTLRAWCGAARDRTTLLRERRARRARPRPPYDLSLVPWWVSPPAPPPPRPLRVQPPPPRYSPPPGYTTYLP